MSESADRAPSQHVGRSPLAALRVKPAIVSCAVPPANSGQAIVLYRLLRELDADAYCLISSDRDSSTADGIAGKQILSARLHRLPQPIRLPTVRRARAVGLAIGSCLTVLQRARRIRELVRREGCNAIIGCTGEAYDLPAAYLAARRLGLPFYAYNLDYYSFQTSANHATARALVSSLERFILQRSAGVIVPNEFLRDEYRRRFGVEAVVVRNPIDVVAEHGSPTPHDIGLHHAPDRAVQLVYTGSVYQAQFDAIRNLTRALESQPRLDAELHIYTSQTPAMLADGGLVRSFVQHAAVSQAESIAVQRAADILFLPLAFDSPYPEIIKTSAPGKLGEYLTSGRPILAHAPADSFLAWYFKTHECGLLVDRPEPDLLRNAIERLTHDAELCRRVVRNAQTCGLEFGLERSRSRFFNVLAA